MNPVYKNRSSKRVQQLIGNSFNGYEIIKELGEGSFSKVYKCSKNGQIFAIKVVQADIKIKVKKVYELFIDEIRLLQIIQNENIIRKIDFFQQGEYLFLVLEYCNGGIFKYYQKTLKLGDLEQLLFEQLRQFKKPFSEEIVTIYFKQIINAFRGLHEQNIVHRDVKAANIFVHNGQLKLGDLGFAKQLNDKNQLMVSILGTPITMAPEVINREMYGIEADMFSLGVVIFQLVTGNQPFIGLTLGQIYNDQKKQALNFNQRPGVKVSNKLQDLLTKMLKFNRYERIQWGDLFDHEFFNNNKKFDPFNKNLLQIPDQNIESLHVSQEMEGIIKYYRFFVDSNKQFYQNKENMKSIDIALQQNQKKMKVIEENKNDYDTVIIKSEVQQIAVNQKLEKSIDFVENQKEENSQEQIQMQQYSMSLIISINGSFIQDVQIDTQMDNQGYLNQNNDNPQQLNKILDSADNLIQIQQNIQKQVVEITNQYLNVLEKIAFISNVASEIYSFENNINKYYPLFVLVKFLFLKLQQFHQSLHQKQNILEIDKDQFQQFINSDFIVKLQTRFNELKIIMKINLEGCINDINDAKIHRNQEYKNHFNNIENPDSQQFYCSILREYFLRVREESELYMPHGDQMSVKILLVHQLAILFCVRDVFHKNIQLDYNYEGFRLKYQKLTAQELQNQIQKTYDELRNIKN